MNTVTDAVAPFPRGPERGTPAALQPRGAAGRAARHRALLGQLPQGAHPALRAHRYVPRVDIRGTRGRAKSWCGYAPGGGVAGRSGWECIEVWCLQSHWCSLCTFPEKNIFLGAGGGVRGKVRVETVYSRKVFYALNQPRAGCKWFAENIWKGDDPARKSVVLALLLPHNAMAHFHCCVQQ